MANVVLLVIAAGCGRCDDEAPAAGYRVQHGSLEVLAVTPPDEFVGRAPLMLPKRAEQEELDANFRQENPNFFAATDPPPPGTRAVAEFEPVDAVYMAFDAATEKFTGRVLRAVLPLVPVIVTLTRDESPQYFGDFVRAIDAAGPDIRLLELVHDNFWTRDFGPVSIELPDGRFAFLDFSYPQTRVLDDGMPSALALAMDVPVFRIPVRLEGGDFMTNGKGLCVTTTTLAVANPDLPFEVLTRQMERVLGCSQLVFLESPRDEATGHVDLFAKFTKSDTVLVGSFDPVENPEDAAHMDNNARLLESIRVGFGRRLRVVRIPMPTPEGSVYRSYTNSLLVNGTALVPTYGRDPGEEKAALEAYRRALPANWQVQTVDASEAIVLGGAIHCAALELRVTGHTK
ncbi:MAG: agmatine deiminase family protein [Acidobacteriota bacterium]|nr:agmatine deiminase family protein [Acidobacteriota bacterium]